MDAIIIRPASVNDLPALIGLTAELGYPESEEEIRRRFEIVTANPSHKIFVAEKDGSIAGLMSFHGLDLLYGEGKLGRITALVVTEKERQRHRETSGDKSRRTCPPGELPAYRTHVE